ncbi:hypothetical protein ACTXT7_017151 [Hymenolepis weldensis]
MLRVALKLVRERLQDLSTVSHEPATGGNMTFIDVVPKEIDYSLTKNPLLEVNSDSVWFQTLNYLPQI